MTHQCATNADGDALLSGPPVVNTGCQPESAVAQTLAEISPVEVNITLSAAQLEDLIDSRIRARVESKARVSRSAGADVVRASPMVEFSAGAGDEHSVLQCAQEGVSDYDSDGSYDMGLQLSPGEPMDPGEGGSGARNVSLSDTSAALTAFLAPLVSGDTVSASGPQPVNEVVELASKNWGQIYNDEEKFGPPVNDELAKMLNKFVRSRPMEEELKKATKDILIPDNTKLLTVPLLNKEFDRAFYNSHGKYMERQICRQTGLACKALAPVIKMLNSLSKGNDGPVDREDIKGLIDSVSLTISMINLQHYTRKQNVLACVREPNLKSLCAWETQVGEKTLFPENIADLLKELKKKHKIGHRQGYFKQSKRLRPDSYYDKFHKGYYRGRSSRGHYSGDRTSDDRRDRGAAQPFLSKRHRGRGKRP